SADNNIARHEQAERDLQERMAEIQTLMETIPAAIWIAHDPDCRRITGNRASYELLRMPRQSNVSKSAPEEEFPTAYRTLMDGREIEPHEHPMQRAAAEGREIRGAEETIAFDDGTQREIYGNASPLFDAEGKVRGVVAAFVDITERKRAEAELRASEARQSLLLRLLRGQRETGDSMAMMSAAAEAVGGYLGANRVSFFDVPDHHTIYFTTSWTDGALEPLSGTRAATGIGARLLAGLQIGRTLDIADAASDPLAADSIFGAMNARAFIVAPIVRSGRWQAGFYVSQVEARRWTDDEIALVRDVADQTWDAVERARFQAALAESERRFRFLAEEGPSYSWVMDGEARLQYVNHRWLDWVGLTMQEAAGYGWQTRIHPDDLAGMTELWIRAAREKAPLAMEHRVKGASGEYRWMFSRALPHSDAQGNMIAWYGLTLDVQDRREAEEALRERAGEIESLNGRLRRSMRETHHRVKNNLQVISAMIDMQVLEHSGAETIPLDEFVRLKTHVHTLSIVHDLLTSGIKEEEEEQRISTKAVLEKLLPGLQQTAWKQSVRYSIDEIELTSKQCIALALVLNELVSNALKHGRKQAEVYFTIGGLSATLAVTDDGDGFPTGFDPAMAANTGLELVESLVRADLQGTIRYGNQLQGGGQVIVTFSLPENKE
ncbi:MAG TPA: PAS domain S-box protein, partial [Ktedonobacteraceae bacterium]|nr:PAS domain S-box protein [Ktedonobacteraceae bacterium]